MLMNQINDFLGIYGEPHFEGNEDAHLQTIFGMEGERNEQNQLTFPCVAYIGDDNTGETNNTSRNQKSRLFLLSLDGHFLHRNNYFIEMERTYREGMEQGAFCTGRVVYTANGRKIYFAAPEPNADFSVAEPSMLAYLNEQIAAQQEQGITAPITILTNTEAEEADPSAEEQAPASMLLSFDQILEDMEELGYHCSETLLAQFLLSFDTNQIIILHGAPGMGKTSFVENFAQAVGAKHKLISVRPNWIDNQDLTGFFNPADYRYYSTPFLDALCEAKENPDKKFIICLDEMNLAHIEYYFSDILSAMESEKKTISLYSERAKDDAVKLLEYIKNNYDADSLEALEADLKMRNLNDFYPPNFEIPSNVVFVGTLNMDATTKGLSPKVIDRSFIIKVTDNTDGLRSNEDASDDFMDQLLDATGIRLSRRAKMHLNAMRGRVDNIRALKGRVCAADVMDFFLACKVLPAMEIEDIRIEKTEDSLTINGFKVIGDGINWDEKYPLTIDFLKQMSDEQDQVLNYWRM